jgi:hypothetical protein
MPRASFIFDSYALLKFFQKEKGYEKKGYEGHFLYFH